MTDTEVKLALGGLLHDIGKLIYRQGRDKRQHSQSGYDFLKDEMQITDPEILDCVRYHHVTALKNAEISRDSLAYIIYTADNIASAADRRQDGSNEKGFEPSMPLQSIFNILNRNNGKQYYGPNILQPEEGIPYPATKKQKLDTNFYTSIITNLSAATRNAGQTQAYLNMLLGVLEENLSYVPSSTAKGERADISLFDHLKITAAVAGCILAYLQEQKIADLRTYLLEKQADFYNKDVFMLYTMDVSGIQDFIYTITSKNALKTLRARSFYLEIMMEHITDCLLQELGLSRANLIYSGGGHCYILMPNTTKAVKAVDDYMHTLNQWLMAVFHISLYVAWGYAPCSANALRNVPHGSYAQIFKNAGEEIAKRKSHRYSASDIRAFNRPGSEDHTRECKVCKNIAKTDPDGICPICRAIERFSKNILYDRFFSVTREREADALPLPGGCFLISDSEASFQKRRQQESFVRAYSKNQIFTGPDVTRLLVGDYTAGKTFEEYAKEADGISRIGIIRADVDDLGQAFVSGFEDPKNQNRYVTLSRTATLSRQLSLFFKLHINRLLAEGTFSIDDRPAHPRNVNICYSGGDDLFIVGAWNEIIEMAVDLRKAFEKYTQGTLTFSAGIGIYTPGYPISAIAREVAGMEDASKSLPGKNSVTLLEDGQTHMVSSEAGGQPISDGTYSWTEFEHTVLGEKYRSLRHFFTVSANRGNSFLYHILELIRGRDEKINFARYVYLLSRLEPGRKEPKEQKAAYREFSSKMYQWIKNEADCRQLKTAITLYAYLTREKEEMKDAGQ